MTDPILRVDGLGFAFGLDAEAPSSADRSFEVGPGLAWLRGGDGSGKTTLLTLLAGERPPARGTLAIRGIRFDADPIGYRRHVAWCDPRTDAFDALPASAYLERLRHDRPALDDAALRRHLDAFGLGPHLAKPIYQLSTGSRRKLWIAGSLASRASLTLLDDPSAALDARSIAHLTQTLADAAADPSRACLVAVYEIPEGLPATTVIDLPDRAF